MRHYVSKAMEALESGAKYTAGWVKKHPVAAAVGATAGAALLDTGMKATGMMGYPTGSPTARFVPYYLNSLACAELNAQRVRNEKGRDLTFGERMTSYLYGSVAPLMLWEVWEEVGATEPFYKALSKVFGEMAQQDFPGKGSFIDLGMTVGAVMATELGKEGVRYLMNRKGRSVKES